MNCNNADNLRRAAVAVQNLIKQVPAGRGRWCDWVPTELERQATEIESAIGYTQPDPHPKDSATTGRTGRAT